MCPALSSCRSNTPFTERARATFSWRQCAVPAASPTWLSALLRDSGTSPPALTRTMPGSCANHVSEPLLFVVGVCRACCRFLLPFLSVFFFPLLSVTIFTTLTSYCMVVYRDVSFIHRHPKGGRGYLMSPPVWNLRVVIIWFPFPLSLSLSLFLIMPSPHALSINHFSANGPFSWLFFQKILKHFRWELGSCGAVRRWQLVGDTCSLLPCALLFAMMHWYNSFLLLLLFLGILFPPFNLVSYFRRNGRRYQHVLVLCAFLSGIILNGLTLRKCV